MMDNYVGNYTRIKEAGMYGPDELTAILMSSVQQKVKEVNSNEDFKDWSIDFIISVCSRNSDKEKEVFGRGI